MAGAADPETLLGLLDDELPAMVDLLVRLVRADSADESLELLAGELEVAGLDTRAVGEHLFARPRRRARGAQTQLLLGRVAAGASGALPTMPVRRVGDRVYGPGALDAKGGLVVLAFALRALAALGLEPAVTPVVLVNADAERGSLDSGRWIRLLARGAVRALVLGPPQGETGLLELARTGSGRFAVEAVDPSDARSSTGDAGARAILELSRQVPRLYALADPAGGVTVEVGEIEAHPRENGEAPSARAPVLVRAATAAAASRVEAAIRALEPTVPGVVLQVSGGFGRPPMERLARNRVLYGAAVRLGRRLGLALGPADTARTASDANTAGRYTATLDGLGPRGGSPGEPDEHVVAASLAERAALLALLLLEPSGIPQLRRRRHRSGGGRVAIVGGAENGANLELVAGWQALGIDAELVPPGEVRRGDVVVGRLDVLPTLSGAEPGLLELLLFERRGIRVLNGAFATVRAHDKLLTARCLARAGVPHPWTVHLTADRPLPQLAPPLVVKPRFGSWGADVYRCETRAELAACLADLGGRRWFRRHGVLLQELVPPVGRDLRVLVAGGRAVGAIQRVAAPGEWRTNICLGGSPHPLQPPEQACRAAEAAATAIGADLVGVDLLPLGDGFTVLELNGAVEFDGGYSLPGRDVFADAAAALGLAPSPASRERELVLAR